MQSQLHRSPAACRKLVLAGHSALPVGTSQPGLDCRRRHRPGQTTRRGCRRPVLAATQLLLQPPLQGPALFAAAALLLLQASHPSQLRMLLQAAAARGQQAFRVRPVSWGGLRQSRLQRAERPRLQKPNSVLRATPARAAAYWLAVWLPSSPPAPEKNEWELGFGRSGGRNQTVLAQRVDDEPPLSQPGSP